MEKADSGDSTAWDGVMSDLNDAVNQSIVASWPDEDEESTRKYLRLSKAESDAKNALENCQKTGEDTIAAENALKNAKKELEEYWSDEDRKTWDRASLEWDMEQIAKQRKRNSKHGVTE